MKFVLNASRLGCWDFATIAEQARTAGFDGVELGASTDDSQFTSANVLLSDLNKVREVFDAAAVSVVALSSPASIEPANPFFAEQMTGVLEAAERLGARIVRVQHRGLARRPSRSALDRRFHALFGRKNEVSDDQLIRAGHEAAKRNVRIVVENAPTAASVEQIWILLERLAHPAIGCSLSLLNATLAKQSPYQTVPMLNQKIFYSEVADARLDGLANSRCILGDGNVPVRDFLTRLLGIGYGGYVALELREDAAAEDIARDGAPKLRQWTQPPKAPVAAARRPRAGAGSAAATDDLG